MGKGDIVSVKISAAIVKRGPHLPGQAAQLAPFLLGPLNSTSAQGPLGLTQRLLLIRWLLISPRQFKQWPWAPMPQ